MSQLSILPNEITKTQDVQNQQIFMALNDTSNWANNSLTQIITDYTEPQGPSDETTSSTSYTNMNNFSHIAQVRNPLCLVSFNFALKGVGLVGLVINGTLVREVFFQGTGFTTVVHSNIYTLKSGKNQIVIQWRALSGTIEKANTSTNPGLNSLQITSFNS
jgi:hypothetical protein